MDSTTCGGNRYVLMNSIIRSFLPEKRRRKLSSRRATWTRSQIKQSLARSFIIAEKKDRKLRRDIGVGTENASDARVEMKESLENVKHEKTRDIGVGTENVSEAQGDVKTSRKKARDVAVGTESVSYAESDTKRLPEAIKHEKEHEGIENSVDSPAAEKMDVSVHLSILREKDKKLAELKQGNAKLIRLVQIFQKRNAVNMKDKDTAEEKLAQYKQRLLEAEKEKEELQEKCISMEGLVKLEQKGGALKELEMQVAEYKCQLAEAAQEKDDIIDEYEDKIEDLQRQLGLLGSKKLSHKETTASP
mmetsp:Transcript_10095/g.14072  ORF Transcript_10095/g.14072 Transcript_10095/m.14072 type:complete len:304 (-) Transcript_10095:216-1127(-)|eukprot:CAMPEP_0184489762 /NCGR_PEP_ID=MMETSP0113_2-20130426/16309_1 /TAXON_ID=91329 /ORGANISM="Norrisiella sphaerica, Strain BC52" /LENGTH=303 /DNA_ID=CAMNT_0026873361 /DNA_START=188 /DNA_END=1099 /DNA_ORIENTATION=+